MLKEIFKPGERPPGSKLHIERTLAVAKPVLRLANFGLNVKANKFSRFKITGSNLAMNLDVKVVSRVGAKTWEGKLTHQFDADPDKWIAKVKPAGSFKDDGKRGVETVDVTVTSGSDTSDPIAMQADIYDSDDPG